jgi:diadenylate cyclase
MNSLVEMLRGFRPQDVVDIAVLAAIIYWLLLLIKGTRAIPILVGLSVLVAAYIMAAYLDLDAIGFLMEHLFSSAVVILVVLFQADIRNALAQVGMTTMRQELSEADRKDLIQEVTQAAMRLARRRIGAIIVLENEVGLRNYEERGRIINAQPTVELLESIFHTASPLHDGAVIISREGVLRAARCILPLTTRPLESPFLGTRHRSALGLTEETDAVVVVASEERGKVSLAYRGQLHGELDEAELRRLIALALQGNHRIDGILESSAQPEASRA